MDWLYPSLSTLWQVGVTIVMIFFCVILFGRLNGLRSFAKFTLYDFATTVAIGSIISSTIVSSSTSVATGALGVGGLLLVQHIVSFFRLKSDTIEGLLSNKPILLMKDGKILRENLDKSKVTRLDLIAKLRESNTFSLDHVKAVVLESTGDISVLHTSENLELDEVILEGVRE